MDELEEIKHTFYEYVENVSSGSRRIAEKLRNNEIVEAFTLISHFAEGMDWLLKVEQHFLDGHYISESSLKEVSQVMIDINEAITNEDYTLTADLFEYEIVPLFDSIHEWTFLK